MNSSSQKPSAKASYAQVAQDLPLMSKDQAIIIDTSGSFTVREYTLALGKQIGPENIRAVSRVSQGRVCFFLNSKDTVDRLIDNESKLTIGELSIPIRPYISRAKRIIISNVLPIIPTQLLIDEFEKLQIPLMSQITYLRAGNNEPGYTHIISFRRQVYINPEDVSKLPPSIKINYDDTIYWIYFSTEKLTCFLCKEEGHVARFCKNVAELPTILPSIETDNGIENEETTKAEKSMASPLTEPMKNKERTATDSIKPTTNAMPPPACIKRPLSSNASSCGGTSTTADQANKKIIKKPKRETKGSEISISAIQAQLDPAKEFIKKNSKNFPLDFDHLSELLFKAYDNINILETSRTYTQDTSAIVNMLVELTPHILERKLKSRIGRLVNKLKKKVLKKINSVKETRQQKCPTAKNPATRKTNASEYTQHAGKTKFNSHFS